MKFDSIRAGIIGFGIGKTYAAALQSIHIHYPDFPAIELVGLATSSSKSAQAGQQRFGFSFATTNYSAVISHPDINLLVLAAPNFLHYDMLKAALPTRKLILSDKPLTHTLNEAIYLHQLSQQLEHDAGMIFEFRHCPAIQLARQLITAGQLGEIYSFRAEYFRSSYTDPHRSLRWKGYAEKGGGVWSDLGSHLIDLIAWLIGLPDKVNAVQRTFIRHRPDEHDPKKFVNVETEDHAIVLAQLPGGATGTFEVARLMIGMTNDLQITIYGSQGSLRWSLADSEYLYLAEKRAHLKTQSWQKIAVPAKYPYSDLPPADFGTYMFRYIIAAFADYIRNATQGLPIDPGVHQGVQVQSVIEAGQRSALQGNWVDVIGI